MNSIKNRIARCHWIWCLVMFFCLSHSVQANESESEGIDIQSLVFEHINDAYSWHVVTINDHHISIPLLCIVKGQNGWDCFCASKVNEGQVYDGYYISEESDNEGKLVEKINGEEVRPLDLSITKDVFSLFLIGGLMLWVFLSIANRYKKNPLEAPSGMQAFLEPVIITIEEDVCKACLGKNYKKFSSYILTVFFFILFTNYLGIIPIFPGGANLTGNIAITFVLAAMTFLITNLTGTWTYWKDVFWPHVPTWLKLPLPIMPFIEVLGLFTKPIALMIRLFANMLSGHIVQLILVGVIFIIKAQFGSIASGCTSVVSVLLAVFMDFLEVLVCLIQAYVFATLSALFIGLSQVEEEEEGETAK